MIDDNTDIIKLQEILLQRIHDQENKILEKVKSYQERNDKKVMNLENELEVQKTRNISMQNIINTHNLLIDKIPDIEKREGLNGEDIFAHKIKITKLEKDLTTACQKYDKIYFDNLILPGVIGDGNRYKNVRDYIEVIILTT